MDNTLRKYKIDTPQYFLYKEMHEKQTLEYVNSKVEQYKKLNNKVMTIHEILYSMDNFIDPSDPDIDLPNSVHAYQTAEMIKDKYPDNYDLQICGLIHDIGKILFKFGEPNWSIVGDTFPVGCQFRKSIIYYDTFINNPDFNKYNSIFGIYKENCGIKNLKMSFGHDEYLYLVLQNNKHNLPERYQNIIRFHSFYSWHLENDYKYFMNEEDEELLKDIKHFNQFDLYSKSDKDFILTPDIINYYSDLLNNYFPCPIKL